MTATTPIAEAITALRTHVRGQVLTPQDEGYDAARRVWNGMIDRHPAVIVRCTGAADVIDAVNFARTHQLAVSVRGGGHNAAGTAVADGGVMIDLSPMDGVRVDPNARTVRVQGGATWGAVDRETQVFGLATPSGYVSTTGVGGFTLGGGYGHLRRKYGMTCDNLIAADVVTADGRLLTVNETEHPDLFWAIRGGGGNFGVVTSFEFACYPVGPMVYLSTTFYPLEEGVQVLRGWRAFLDTEPDELSALAAIWGLPDIEAFPPDARGRAVVVASALYLGDVAEGERLTQPLRQLGTPLLDMSGPTPYTAAQSGLDGFFPSGDRYYFKAIDLTSMSDDVIDLLVRHGWERPTLATLMPIWHFGGAISRVDPTATAFWRRHVPFMVSFDPSWTDPADDERCITWARNAWASMRPYSDGGFYVNFPGQNEEGDALVRGAYGGNYARLQQIKAKYDPDNLFHLNTNIRPAPMASVAGHPEPPH